MKKRKEKRRQLKPLNVNNARSYRPKRTGVVFALFLAGSALLIPKYFFPALGRGSPCQNSLLVFAPSLPAGGMGYIYVCMKKLPAEQKEIPVQAVLTGKQWRKEAKGMLHGSKACRLALNLEGIRPGHAELTVRAGSFSVRKQVNIGLPQYLQLWAAGGIYGENLKIKALLSARSSLNGKVLPGRSVSFRLYSPQKLLIASRRVSTDRYGVAQFTHRFPELPPPGNYRITAVTNGEQLTSGFAISGKKLLSPPPHRAHTEATGKPPLLAITPEAGFLVSGLKNTVEVARSGKGAVNFPVGIKIDDRRKSRFVLEKDHCSFQLKPPAGRPSLTFEASWEDSAGKKCAERRELQVRGSEAILLRPQRHTFEPGEQVKIDLTRKDLTASQYVLELLFGDTVVDSLTGTIRGGHTKAEIKLPEGLYGRFFVRVWPVSPKAAQLFTFSRISVPPRQARNRFAVKKDSPRALRLINKGGARFSAVYTIKGTARPRRVANSPSVLSSSPLALSTTRQKGLPGGKVHRNSLYTGVILLLAFGPLLYALAVILSPFGGRGFLFFLLIVLLVYLVTVLNSKFFGTLLLALGLFRIYRVFRAEFNSLTGKTRNGIRWAVPALCLAPYIQFAHPLQPHHNRVEPASTHDRSQAQHLLQSPKPLLLKAGSARLVRVEPEETWLFTCMIGDNKEHQTFYTHFEKQDAISVELEAPRSLTAGKEGDRVNLPFRIKNHREEAWQGALSVTGSGVSCEFGESLNRIALAGGESFASTVTVTAFKPGKGFLTLAWKGEKHGQRTFNFQILPAGNRHVEVANGFCSKGCSSFSSSFFLPQKTLYHSARLRAKVYPGGLSQILTVLRGTNSLPWRPVKKNIARAHAACVFLFYMHRTGENSGEELHVRGALGSALLHLAPFLHDSSGKSLLNPQERLRVTGSILFLLQDLKEIWPLQTDPLEDLARFAQSQVRADGTFRTGKWIRKVSPEDIMTTCFLACSLDQETPKATRRFLKKALIEEHRPELTAPLLAANLTAGKVEPRLAAKKEKLLEAYMRAGGKKSQLSCAWLAYYSALRLQTSPSYLQTAKKAIAHLACRRNRHGLFSSLTATQLFLRSLKLCARQGERLTQNEFTFSVNSSERSLFLKRSDPDILASLDLTPMLQMRKNRIRVESTGSLFTPYQLIFSYAVGWKGRNPSPWIDIEMKTSSSEMVAGKTGRIRLRLQNLTSRKLGPVSVLLRVPPLVKIQGTGASGLNVSGDRSPGDTALLTLRSLPKKGTVTVKVDVVPVTTGKAYIRPASAYAGPKLNRPAFSNPCLIQVKNTILAGEKPTGNSKW